MFIPIHLTLLLVATHPQLHLLPYPANAVQKCPHSTRARVSKGEEDVGTNLAAEKLAFALRTPKRKEKKTKQAVNGPEKMPTHRKNPSQRIVMFPNILAQKYPNYSSTRVDRSCISWPDQSRSQPERLNLHLSAVPWLQSSWFNIV